MEKLHLFVYFFWLITLGGEIAGTTYFTMQSQRQSLYFNTRHMDEDARWGYLIFIFLYYSAIASSITFVILVISPYFSGIWTSKSETPRKRPKICRNLLGIVTAAIFLTFQLLITLRIKRQWHFFDEAGVRDYTRQCHALFALAFIPQSFLALSILITFIILFCNFF